MKLQHNEKNTLQCDSVCRSAISSIFISAHWVVLYIGSPWEDKKKRQKIVINVLMFLNLFLKYTQVTFEWCTCNISTAHRKGDLANIVRKGVRMLSAICHIGVPSQAITRNQQKKKKRRSCSIPLIQELHFKQFDLKETHCTRKTTSRNSHKTIPHWSMPTWNGDKTRSSEGPLRVSLIEA